MPTCWNGDRGMKSLSLRDDFVLQHRPAKHPLDPYRAYASMWEEERDSRGTPAPTAVVFLTNRECPFRCVMCDLWVNTLDDVIADGLIAGQLRVALGGLPAARQIKLYNAGSFFDSQAIPPADDGEIASIVAPFERVVVDAHPALVQERAASAACREQLVTRRIVDHRLCDVLTMAQGDRHCVLRKAVDEVRRAIERVDDPRVLGFAARAGLLGQHGMVRVGLQQQVDDRRLGGRSVRAQCRTDRTPEMGCRRQGRPE